MITFKQFICEKREKITHAGYKDSPVSSSMGLFNPTSAKEILDLLTKSKEKEIRFIFAPKAREVYVWDAYYGEHNETAIAHGFIRKSEWLWGYMTLTRKTPYFSLENIDTNKNKLVSVAPGFKKILEISDLPQG